ncbi:MAG: hypothetical protein HEQ39_09625 [Rhizobacter sp.]
MSQIKKTCTLCRCSKTLDHFHKSKVHALGVKARCAECLSVLRRQGQAKESDLKYQANLALFRKTDEGREWNRLKQQKYHRKSALIVTTGYARRYLAKQLGVCCQDVPNELIPLKIEQLTARQLARQLKKVINESSKNTP